MTAHAKSLAVNLAAEINAEHRACMEAMRGGLEHAIEAGRLLIEAKAQCSHGDWLPWLAEHFEADAQTAQRYMRSKPPSGEASEPPTATPSATAPTAPKAKAPAALGRQITVDPRAFLESLSRPALQALARSRRVKGGQRSSEIIEELLAQQKPGQAEIDWAAELKPLHRAGGVVAKVVLLWVLGYMIACGECPDSAQVLAGAREVEPILFANWSSRGVELALGQYGCVTFKRHGRRDYSHVTLDDLRRIETTYGCNLGLPEPKPEPERARVMLADGA